MRRSVVVYLLGVMLLGLFYRPIQAATGPGVPFLVACVAFLLVLRILGSSLDHGPGDDPS